MSETNTEMVAAEVEAEGVVEVPLEDIYGHTVKPGVNHFYYRVRGTAVTTLDMEAGTVTSIENFEREVSPFANLYDDLLKDAFEAIETLLFRHPGLSLRVDFTARWPVVLWDTGEREVAVWSVDRVRNITDEVAERYAGKDLMQELARGSREEEERHREAVAQTPVVPASDLLLPFEQWDSGLPDTVREAVHRVGLKPLGGEWDVFLDGEHIASVWGLTRWPVLYGLPLLQPANFEKTDRITQFYANPFTARSDDNGYYTFNCLEAAVACVVACHLDGWETAEAHELGNAVEVLVRPWPGPFKPIEEWRDRFYHPDRLRRVRPDWSGEELLACRDYLNDWLEGYWYVPDTTEGCAQCWERREETAAKIAAYKETIKAGNSKEG